jgi:ParB-like chromosome segregation protein Spo0J
MINQNEIIEVKVGEIKANPNNPRIIKDDKFKKLVKSIQDFPEMLKLRPIVVNDDMVVLGGNMRLKACKEAGLKMIPIIKANQLTEQQQKEFIVKDNVGYGEWDWDDLANNWDAEQLTDWGLDIPNFNTEGFADKNKELSLNDITDLMTINLKYTEEEYHIVKDALLKIASTPEQAIWKLLGND